MWNIKMIKQVDNYYIVMTPDGETHCIDNTTFELFKKQNRIIGVINKVDI
jgi:hypothetical protein